MKKLFLLLSIFVLSGSVHAQIYTDGGENMAGPPPPPQPSRYRLRQNYPMYYPLPPGSGTNNSSDTVEVGRPNYYPNYGYPDYPYPSGVQSDGDSIYVPGR